MLSLPLTRILAAGSLGVVSAGLVAKSADAPGATERFQAPRSLGSYEARLTGATAATLRSTVAVGNPSGDDVPGTFVITLGPGSEDGSLVLSRRQAAWPEPGSYPISGEPSSNGFTALVVPGSPSRPLGLFRAERGTLTITSLSAGAIAGRFELHARGFAATEPEREDRELIAEGSFIGIAPERSATLR